MSRSFATSGASPGGSDKDVQFNDDGSFNGDSNLVWDKTLQQLNIKHDADNVGGTSTLRLTESSPAGGDTILDFYHVNQGAVTAELRSDGGVLVISSRTSVYIGYDGVGGGWPDLQLYVTGFKISTVQDSGNMAILQTNLLSGNQTYHFPDASGTFMLTGSGTGQFADNETPSGSIDGSNVTFTLANSPTPTASLQLIYNGQFQLQGSDYTLSGGTVTFAVAPFTGTWLRAFYRY